MTRRNLPESRCSSAQCCNTQVFQTRSITRSSSRTDSLLHDLPEKLQHTSTSPLHHLFAQNKPKLTSNKHTKNRMCFQQNQKKPIATIITKASLNFKEYMSRLEFCKRNAVCCPEVRNWNVKKKKNYRHEEERLGLENLVRKLQL